MDELYARTEHGLAMLQLGFAMLGMGALLRPRDFVTIFRSPRALAVGLALQWVAVPALASALPQLVPMTAGFTVGLVLIAAVPGGTMSNLFTHFARGNLALSISLTAVTSVASLFVTPLLLRTLAGQHLPPDFRLPTLRIATDIGLALLIPLLAGMLLGARLGPRRAAFSRLAIRASLILILLIVVGAAAARRIDPTRHAGLEQLVVPLLGVAFFLVAELVTRVARLPAGDRAAIAIEASLRNVNLAILVKASLFPASGGDPVGDDVLLAVALYGGSQMAIAAVPIVLQRLGRAR